MFNEKDIDITISDILYAIHSLIVTILLNIQYYIYRKRQNEKMSTFSKIVLTCL